MSNTRESTPAVFAAPDPRDVFVVHGRNTKVHKSLRKFLRAIGLHPIKWEEMVAATGKGAPYIGEVLRAGFAKAQVVVVLLTGDDRARLRHRYLQDDDPEYERELRPQPRPNVLFEAGMALGIHPDRTILVQVGELRPFSDIAGRHIIKLSDSKRSRKQLIGRLKTAGCPVETDNEDWKSVGDFDT